LTKTGSTTSSSTSSPSSSQSSVINQSNGAGANAKVIAVATVGGGVCVIGSILTIVAALCQITDASCNRFKDCKEIKTWNDKRKASNGELDALVN